MFTTTSHGRAYSTERGGGGSSLPPKIDEPGILGQILFNLVQAVRDPKLQEYPDAVRLGETVAREQYFRATHGRIYVRSDYMPFELNWKAIFCQLATAIKGGITVETAPLDFVALAEVLKDLPGHPYLKGKKIWMSIPGQGDVALFRLETFHGQLRKIQTEEGALPELRVTRSRFHLLAGIFDPKNGTGKGEELRAALRIIDAVFDSGPFQVEPHLDLNSLGSAKDVRGPSLQLRQELRLVAVQEQQTALRMEVNARVIQNARILRMSSTELKSHVNRVLGRGSD